MSRVVVLGASALESTRIMLNSVSRIWPNGIANSGGVLGHYLMDNFGGPRVSAFLPELVGSEVTNDDGKNSGVDIVPYRNITSRHPKFIRSYTHEGGSGARMSPGYAQELTGFGPEFKKRVRRYYPATISFNTRAEMLARWENYVEIDKNVRDAWGIPVLKIHCQFSDNEREMAKDALENLKELFHAARAEIYYERGEMRPPGSMIHEMGTCRMGEDSKKSVLNKFNQKPRSGHIGPFPVLSSCSLPSPLSTGATDTLPPWKRKPAPKARSSSTRLSITPTVDTNR